MPYQWVLWVQKSGVWDSEDGELALLWTLWLFPYSVKDKMGDWLILAINNDNDNNPDFLPEPERTKKVSSLRSLLYKANKGTG